MPLAASSLICSVAIALAAPAAPVEAAKPSAGVLLRYRFTEGENVAYRIDHDTTFIASKGQLREKTASRTTTDQRFHVVAVDSDGAATLHVVIDHARMQYAFNDEKPSVFDSNEKVLPAPIFAGVSRAVGRPLAEIRVRASGAVESARPLLSTDELNNTPGKAGLEGDGSASLFSTLPDGPVRLNDEWSDTFVTRIAVTQKLHRDVTILRQYRLESVENGIATISCKSSPLTAVTDPGQLVQLIQRTAAGTIRFDIHAGRVIGRSTKVDNIEIGWAGADSSYRALCTFDEQLVTEEPKLSSR